jgi:hypothetical protein
LINATDSIYVIAFPEDLGCRLGLHHSALISTFEKINLMKQLLIALSLALASVSQAQNIVTIAGTGTAGFSGDGGPAVSASLNNPHGIDVDSFGNIYIADQLNHRIRKINPEGIITTIAGTGTSANTGDGALAINASLHEPYTVKWHKGAVYITAQTKIRKIDANGIITTIAGTGAYGYSGNNGPATAAMIDNPAGIVFDKNDNLFFCDHFNHRIRRIDAITGVITTIAGTGMIGFSGDNGPAANAQLFYPNYLSIDTSGNLYVSDNTNQRVRKIDTAGVITTIAGNGTNGYYGNGSVAAQASLSWPAGSVCDSVGNFFIADPGNNRIRVVDASGVINNYAGTGTAGFSGDNGPALNASLNSPVDVKVDRYNNLLVVDYLNNRIRKIINPASVNASRKEDVLTVFPNPAKHEFYVSLDEAALLTVFNMTGQLVYSRSLEKGRSSVSVGESMPAGCYIVKCIAHKSGKLSSARLVVQ